MLHLKGDDLLLLLLREALGIELRDLRECVGDVFRGAGVVEAAYFVGEGEGALHGCGVGFSGDAAVAEYILGEGVDDADKPRGGVEGELFDVPVGDVVADVVGYHIFLHGEHEHLVVGEDAFLYGVGEVYAIDFVAVDVRVVHRAEDEVVLAGLDFGAFAVEAGRGGHVHAFVALHEVIRVYFGEVAFVAPESLTPVVRCASSQTMKSKRP